MFVIVFLFYYGNINKRWRNSSNSNLSRYLTSVNISNFFLDFPKNVSHLCFVVYGHDNFGSSTHFFRRRVNVLQVVSNNLKVDVFKSY